MEIIKQLYDIGNLFDISDDLKIIKETFSKFSKAELAYRGILSLSAEDIFEDIFQTSLSIATHGKAGNANFDELSAGIKRVKNFIFSENYQIDKAITHASKAAYIASVLKYDAHKIERFDPSLDMKNWIIEQPFNTRVNKLKKSNQEAFYYWFKIFELQSKGRQ